MFAVVYNHQGTEMVPSISNAAKARENAKKCIAWGRQGVKVVQATEKHEILNERYRDWASDVDWA